MSKLAENDLAQDDVRGIASPRIIPPEKHPITPSQIDRDALFVLRKLSEAGYAGYLVGGGVRDLYLGKKPKDFDISTDARPGQLRKLFPNSNTIGRRFRLVQVFFKGGKTVEVSTLRSLSEHDLDGPEAVLAPNNTFGTLSEDARRRDLTINSLFYEIEKGTIIDYVEGSLDLDRRLIRIVGDPDKRIKRDPVRMMRAIRHAARNGFTIEDASWRAIHQNCDSLSLCPPSRLRDEFLKDLYGGAIGAWFRFALDSGIFYQLFPLYRKMLQDQERLDLLEKIFSVIDQVNASCVVRKIHRQPDFFLLALVLIPWVEAEHNLYTVFRKGGPLYGLGRNIREELDRGIGVSLNLRRSLRQELVSLLINLAQLIHNRQKDGWPKWLRRKSYFRRAQLFHQFYMAAAEGGDAAAIFGGAPVLEPQEKRVESPVVEIPLQKCRPAFASNTKGGVFGFRK